MFAVRSLANGLDRVAADIDSIGASVALVGRAIPVFDASLLGLLQRGLRLDSLKQLADWAPAALKPIVALLDKDDKPVLALDAVVDALLAGGRAQFGAKLTPLGFAAPRAASRNADSEAALALTVGATPLQINAGFCNDELRIDVNVGVAALLQFRPLLGELLKLDGFKYSTDVSASLRIELSVGQSPLVVVGRALEKKLRRLLLRSSRA